MKSISNLFVNKLSALFLIAAIAGMVSVNAYAHTDDYMGFGGFHHFNGFGYGFGGFHHFNGFGYGFGGFGGFGGFAPGMEFGYGFGGHHFDAYSAVDFNGFGYGFTAQNPVHASNRKIVPLPPTASTVNTSITYDESGELHVRPFDDEDLFVED
ncbi:MAG: hypothetical protein IJT68_03490 [Lentisphaeria bacterium]|nr:hypothetical protein [Lentisphaeria bacterium]